MDVKVTHILEEIAEGDQSARQRLILVLYDELKKLAEIQMAGEAADHTLQPTALVHEAFLKLISLDSCSWENRYHFFASAANVMRRILIDYARTKKRLKRGGARQRVELEQAEECALPEEHADLLDLDEALTEFERLSPTKAELVKLRFFVGMTNQQSAKVLGLSHATAARHWAFARAWLYNRMKQEPTPE